MKLQKIVKTGATIQYQQYYLGGIEYRQNGTGSTRVEAIYHDEGRYLNLNAEVNNTLLWQKEYTLKDHLGNARVTFTEKNLNGIVDIPSDIVQENHYYPFGLNYEGGWRMNDAVARDNKYQYNNKEWNDDFGLNLNDYGARFYDPAVGRFTTIDRFSEKYSFQTPYAYGANNPIRFIDVNGDSIKVGEAHREQFNKALASVFGDKASNFSYNKNGNLTYSGDSKGLDKDQKSALEGLQKVMGEEIITNVVFGKSTEVTLKDGTKATLKASDGGGAATALVGEANVSENTILVDADIKPDLKIFEVTPAYYITPIDPANGPRFKETTVKTNVTDALFHEIGHVVHRGETQDKVINYNNSVRKVIGFEKRPYDETHNKNVKTGNY